MSTINKINVGGTEYEVGGGSKLYRHTYIINFINNSNGYSIICEYEEVSTNQTPKTIEELATTFYEKLTRKSFSTQHINFNCPYKDNIIYCHLTNNYYGSVNINLSYMYFQNRGDVFAPLQEAVIENITSVESLAECMSPNSFNVKTEEV